MSSFLKGKLAASKCCILISKSDVSNIAGFISKFASSKTCHFEKKSHSHHFLANIPYFCLSIRQLKKKVRFPKSIFLQENQYKKLKIDLGRHDNILRKGRKVNF